MHIGEDARLLIKVIDWEEETYADNNPISIENSKRLLIRVIDDMPERKGDVDIILTKDQLKPTIKALKKKLKELT